MFLKKISLLLMGIPIFLTDFVSAHCPLCTVGAGAAAAGAVWLGVSKIVVALFIGAFAMSMGMWFAKVIEKRKSFLYFQNTLIIVGVFLLTIIPLMSITKVYGPLPIQITGNYGSLLNRTYMLDYSLAGSLLGGLIVFISPTLNRKLKKKRKGIPFQGVVITFSLLLIASVIIQYTL